MTAPGHYRLLAAAVALAVGTSVGAPALSRERVRSRADSAPRPTASASQPPLDDLYRRRGYGVGGTVFGGDTAMAGSCADLRSAQKASCGRGYGVYGNGLGTRFGF